MNQPQSLGPLMLDRRRQLGRCQERVAELMCEALGRPTVTKNEISRYEREERVPIAASLRALAIALDLPRSDVDSRRLPGTQKHTASCPPESCQDTGKSR